MLETEYAPECEVCGADMVPSECWSCGGCGDSDVDVVCGVCDGLGWVWACPDRNTKHGETVHPFTGDDDDACIL